MSGPRRLEELLAERATQGLGADERRELGALLAASPETDADAFDFAAAAVDLALIEKVEPMPARVRRAVLARARDEWAVADPAPTLAPVADLAEARSRRQPDGAEPATPSGAWVPWLAAAAALALAVAGWWPRAQGGDRAPVTTAASSIEAVEAAPDAVRWAWSGTEDPVVGEVGGEVVWSGAEQRGFLRIRGLAANDPGVEQYQLWIFDRARDERYPVDGGVFDVVGDGDGDGGREIVVAIDAKIAVDDPYLFAVTVEQPGGVVVSSRERIVLLAQA